MQFLVTRGGPSYFIDIIYQNINNAHFCFAHTWDIIISLKGGGESNKAKAKGGN